MSQPGIPSSGNIASIFRAAQRLNPAVELDVDVLTVARAGVVSTAADWAAGVLSSVVPDGRTGAIRLTEGAPSVLFSQTAAATVPHGMRDGSASNRGVEIYTLNFFPSPAITQGVAFALDSIDLYLARTSAPGHAGITLADNGKFRFVVGYYDQNWRAVPMGDAIDIPATAVSIAGGVFSLNFRNRGQLFVFDPGNQNTNTGPGFDGTNSRTLNQDALKVSHIPNISRGLWISVQPVGKGFLGAWVGCVANATAAQFDTTQFWRHAANRETGPYDPSAPPFSGNDTGHNPDDYLVTGAVPGFGAKAVANGSWGIARRVARAQIGQDNLNTWEQPYHVLRIVTYAATGSAVEVIDLGAIPTNDLEVRLDDWQPLGTSIAYSLQGSNTSGAGPWLPIATVTDGTIIASGNYFRWYQLTATLTPGPTGATKFASPAVQAWQMVERVPLSTYRLLRDVDADMVVDPLTGQSSIAELKLPVIKAGRRDYRDLGTQLGSNYAPSTLEAHVFARNTVTGKRYFLNSFRLEDRNPVFDAEEMVFVSGFDRLTVKIPAPVETFRYPVTSGQATITNVTHVGSVYSITVAGTPFTPAALANYRMHGVTGACAGLDYPVQSAPPNTSSIFAVGVVNQAPPAIGDTFEIHSDQTTRVGAAYVGQDFAAIYTDLLSVQAAVPARLRGQQPLTTGRLGSYTLPGDGVKALDVLQNIALHCGGFLGWNKGRIDFCDLYSKDKVSLATWTDREIVSIDTPVGADRRMPSVRVKYGYQADTKKFAFQATYDDNDTLVGWGRPNLFDVFEVPDDVCVWNDVNEAKWLSDTFQRAWKSGVRLWKVKTAFMYPWLDMGAGVTIVTDQYADRKLAFTADGLTDIGIPLAGKLTVTGVIVGKNLWGTDFVIAVRGLDDISGVAQTGSQSGTVSLPGAPRVSVSFDSNGQTVINSTGDASTISQVYVIRTDRVPTEAETRAGVIVGSQSLVNIGTGVYVRPGHPIFYGVFAYNSAGGESTPLTSGEVMRQGGAFGAMLLPHFHLVEEEAQKVGIGGYAVPLGRIHAIPLFSADGATPLVDTFTKRVQPGLQANDGEPGIESQRAATRKGAQAAGHGAQGITEEEHTRVGFGGIPVPAARVHTLTLYDASGGVPLIDTATKRIQSAALGPAGIGMDTVERGGNKGDNALDSGFVAVAASIDLSRAYTNKHLGNIPDDVASDRRAATANQKTGGDRGFGGFGNTTGGLVSTATDSSGLVARQVVKLFAKTLSGDPDTFTGVPDDVTYKKIVSVNGSGQITPLSSSDRFRCKAAITFSLAHNSPTFAAPTTEVYDFGSIHDNVTNPSWFVVPTGGNRGVWKITGSGSFPNNVTGYRNVAIYKNGVLTDANAVLQAVTAGVLTAFQVSFEDDAPAVGDRYEVLVSQTSGVALNVTVTITVIHQW